MNKKIKVTALAVLLSLALFVPGNSLWAQARSYYVSADGSDGNDGRSLEAPFQTLNRAIALANTGAIKTITIVGEVGGNGSFDNTGAEIRVVGVSKPDNRPERLAAAEAAAAPLRAQAEKAAANGETAKNNAAAADQNLKNSQAALAAAEGDLKRLAEEQKRVQALIENLSGPARTLREAADAERDKASREETDYAAAAAAEAAAIRNRRERREAEAANQKALEEMILRNREAREPGEAAAAAAEQALKEQSDQLASIVQQSAAASEAAETAREEIVRYTAEKERYTAEIKEYGEEAAKYSAEADTAAALPPLPPVLKGRIDVRGNSRVRFENITLTNGLWIVRGTVTLGRGVKVTGTGITVDGGEWNDTTNTFPGGTLVMEADAEVSGCSGNGITIDENSSFTLRGNAKISNNGNTGVVVMHGTFIMEGNAVISNNARGVMLSTVDVLTFFAPKASFTLRGNASITDNGHAGTLGGGVFVDSNAGTLVRGGNVVQGAFATFTMQGGTISGNIAKEGGGVYTRGTFAMSGGTISGNRAELGAGVYAAPYFRAIEEFEWPDKCTLAGGSITNNEAAMVGGGVYVTRGAHVTQGASIRGNRSGDGSGSENLFRQQ